ncbi:MAG: hypothetical protein M1831_001554 [Alyxoria varia]|nr:MAG: hypothetical protein M1831_001554 [Alyxoria varia]
MTIHSEEAKNRASIALIQYIDNNPRTLIDNISLRERIALLQRLAEDLKLNEYNGSRLNTLAQWIASNKLKGNPRKHKLWQFYARGSASCCARYLESLGFSNTKSDFTPRKTEPHETFPQDQGTQSHPGRGYVSDPDETGEAEQFPKNNSLLAKRKRGPSLPVEDKTEETPRPRKTRKLTFSAIEVSEIPPQPISKRNRDDDAQEDASEGAARPKKSPKLIQADGYSNSSVQTPVSLPKPQLPKPRRKNALKQSRLLEKFSDLRRIESALGNEWRENLEPERHAHGKWLDRKYIKESVYKREIPCLGGRGYYPVPSMIPANARDLNDGIEYEIEQLSSRLASSSKNENAEHEDIQMLEDPDDVGTQAIYRDFLGPEWKSVSKMLKSRQSTAKAGHVIRGLVAATVTKRVLMTEVPWPCTTRLIRWLEEEDLLVNVYEALRDRNIETWPLPHAQKFADELQKILTPHAEIFNSENFSNPSKEELLSAFHNKLVHISRKAMLLKAHLDNCEEDYRFLWYPPDTPADPETMEVRRVTEEKSAPPFRNLQESDSIAFTLHPGLVGRTKDNRAFLVRKACVELWDHGQEIDVPLIGKLAVMLGDAQ